MVRRFFKLLYWLQKEYHLRFEEHDMEPIPDYGDVFKMRRFIAMCECGGFINYDGFAHPIVKGKMDGDVFIRPSEILKGKHRKYKSVVWFNR